MAGTILNTLYPPLVDTFQPSFPSQQSAEVTFTISPYNSYLDINYLHVTLVDQKTNKSVLDYNIDQDSELKGTVIINGIWIIPFAENIVITGENGQQVDSFINNFIDFNFKNNLYKLHIPKSILKSINGDEDKSFNINNYYKVQLRFDKYAGGDSTFSLIDQTSSYLINKRIYFSEWSSVTLIKACPTIVVHLNNFTYEEYDNSGNAINYESEFSIIDYKDNANIPRKVPEYVPGTIPFAGNLFFIDGTTINDSTIATTSGPEYLDHYSMKVYLEDNLDEPIRESGTLYPAASDGINTFYWLCDMTSVESNKNYILEIIFTTNNQYTFSKLFEFSVVPQTNLIFNPVFSYNEVSLPAYGQEKSFINTEEDGWLEISISSTFGIDSGSNNPGDPQNNNSLRPGGYLFTKRASSLDNFLEWELIDCVYIHEKDDSIEQTDPNLIIEDTQFTRKIIDYTIGSLISYRYSCQFLRVSDEGTTWSRVVKDEKSIYPNFHDILISRDNRQLAIRYNGQISSMTSVTNRIKIDTLGGKYPKFAENAKLRYKQFQINGLITAEEDYNRKFLNDLDFSKEMTEYDSNMDGKYSIRNDTYREVESLYGTYSTEILENDTIVKQNKAHTQKNTYHDIYPTDNWWWERKFREEVVNWLNDGNPKLYRSMTEGNLIVMFNDISLTPNAQLGRRIWNFSATVYEVGDGYSLDELSKSGIITLNNDYNALSATSKDPNQITILDNSITKITLGQLAHVMADPSQDSTVNGRTSIVISATEDDGVPHRMITNTNGEEASARYMTITDQISEIYTGLYKNYSFVDKTSPLNLTSVKIQFESKPQWYNLESFSANKDVFGFRMTLTIGGTKWEVKLKRAEGLVSSQIQWEVEVLDRETTIEDFTTWISTWEETKNNLIKIDYNDDIIETNISDLELTIKQIIEEEEKKQNYGLGYKLGLLLTSANNIGSEIFRIIFVNEKGYYQIPSNVIVKNIFLYDEAIATIDYIAKYKITYGTENRIVSYSSEGNIVGQISGEWSVGTNIVYNISQKYYSYSEARKSGGNTIPASSQYIGELKCISYEGTPYTILNITSSEDPVEQSYIVGRTGVLNLETDYPIIGCNIGGRRMVETTEDRQNFLDEWEYILDPSVTYNSIDTTNDFGWIVYDATSSANSFKLYKVNMNSNNPNDISIAFRRWYDGENKRAFDSVEELELKPNTVYGIIDNSEGFVSYKIYYLDRGLYNINFLAENYSIAQAYVPVYGMINYRTTLIKKIWEDLETTVTSTG